MRIFLLLILSAHILLSAAAPYGLLTDTYMSPYAGADTLMLPQKALMNLQEYWNLRTCKKNFLFRIERLSELIFLWDPMSYMLMVTQHEVFGHGYRIRSLGSYYATVCGYGMGAPPPYGPGGGFTSYNISPTLTTSKEIAITAAGVEATGLLAGELKKKWILDRKIDPRQASLYLYSEHDLSRYIFEGLSGNEFDLNSGNDMEAYLFWLNSTYPQGYLSENNLKTYALVNLVDPTTFYAIYAWFNYVASGENSSIPMIPLFSTRLLPNLRLSLTPFGPEVLLENYLTYKSQLTYFYFKAGEFAGNQYYGLGIENKTLWSYKKCCFGLRFDGWKQPLYSSYLLIDALDNTPAPAPTTSGSYGAALQATLYYPLTNKMNIYAVVGGKTSGFLPGESLYTNPILRIGLFGML